MNPTVSSTAKTIRDDLRRSAVVRSAVRKSTLMTPPQAASTLRANLVGKSGSITKKKITPAAMNRPKTPAKPETSATTPAKPGTPKQSKKTPSKNPTKPPQQGKKTPSKATTPQQGENTSAKPTVGDTTNPATEQTPVGTATKRKTPSKQLSTPKKENKKTPAAAAKSVAKTAKKVRLESPAAETKKKQSGIPKRKMPNFAKLHEKAFGRMDTLETYMTKKKVRRDAMTPGAVSAKKGAKAAAGPSVKDIRPVPMKSVDDLASSAKKSASVNQVRKSSSALLYFQGLFFSC